MYEDLVGKLRSVFPESILISCRYESKIIIKAVDESHITLMLQVNKESVRSIARALNSWLENKGDQDDVIKEVVKLGQVDQREDAFYLFVSKLNQIVIKKITDVAISEIFRNIELLLTSSQSHGNSSRENAEAIIKQQCYEQLLKVIYQPEKFPNDYTVAYDPAGEGTMILRWRRAVDGDLILAKLFNFLEIDIGKQSTPVADIEENDQGTKSGAFCVLIDKPILDDYMEIRVKLITNLRVVLVDQKWKESISGFHDGITSAIEMTRVLKATISSLSTLQLTATSWEAHVPSPESLTQTIESSNHASARAAENPSSLFKSKSSENPDSKSGLDSKSGSGSKSGPGSQRGCSVM